MGASEPSTTTITADAVNMPEFCPTRRFWAAFSSLLVVILASALDATSLSTALSFGRKYLIILAFILFTVGSIVAAVAHDMTTLLIGRSIQGAGGG
ncbi:unnamed protein product [Penicillium manginii]